MDEKLPHPLETRLEATRIALKLVTEVLIAKAVISRDDIKTVMGAVMRGLDTSERSEAVRAALLSELMQIFPPDRAG